MAEKHGADYHRDYLTDLVGNRSSAWLEAELTAAAVGAAQVQQPLLAVVHTPAPHRPLPPITPHSRPPPPITAHYRQLPPTTAHYRLFPSTTANYRPLPLITTHYRPLPSIIPAITAQQLKFLGHNDAKRKATLPNKTFHAMTPNIGGMCSEVSSSIACALEGETTGATFKAIGGLLSANFNTTRNASSRNFVTKVAHQYK